MNLSFFIFFGILSIILAGKLLGNIYSALFLAVVVLCFVAVALSTSWFLAGILLLFFVASCAL